jgi:L-ascorbate metabolism protein UlaG (beta-lactamase superfamily)
MKIRYLGHSSFLIKGKNASLLTDPYDSEMLGFKFPNVSADIVTVSHDHKDHNQTDLVKEKHIIFDFPGEYESKGIRVYGYLTSHDHEDGTKRGENIMFKFIVDGITILHCGDLGAVPSAEIMTQVEDADILLVPTGGTYTIDAKEAKILVEKISPEIIIPMHYHTEGINEGNFSELSPVNEFLRLFGKEGIEPQKELDIKKEELPENEVIVLERYK